MSASSTQKNSPLIGSVQEPSSDGLKIIAKSVHRELKANGCDDSAMLTFANALLDLVTEDMGRRNAAE